MTDKPMTVIPLSCEDVLSILRGVGGVLLTGVDYNGDAHALVNKLIDLIEKEPQNG